MPKSTTLMKSPETTYRLVTRRAFLRSTAVTATGAAASFTISRAAHSAGSDVIKISLIGCGGRGTGAAAQALSTKGSVKLWGMADAFEDNLETSLAALSKGDSCELCKSWQRFRKGGTYQISISRNSRIASTFLKSGVSSVSTCIGRTPSSHKLVWRPVATLGTPTRLCSPAQTEDTSCRSRA
jgi:hypothetical protein